MQEGAFILSGRISLFSPNRVRRGLRLLFGVAQKVTKNAIKGDSSFDVPLYHSERRRAPLEKRALHRLKPFVTFFSPLSSFLFIKGCAGVRICKNAGPSRKNREQRFPYPYLRTTRPLQTRKP